MPVVEVYLEERVEDYTMKIEDEELEERHKEESGKQTKTYKERGKRSKDDS